MFGLSKFDMDQLQDIMNIYQDLGITIMKEKINAWYSFKSQNSDKPFEMSKYHFIINNLNLIIFNLSNLLIFYNSVGNFKIIISINVKGIKFKSRKLRKIIKTNS